MNGDFVGTGAIVTGGASGIGAACARMVAERGGAVIVLDRDGDGAAAVAQACGGRGAALDVADAEAVHALIGRLDATPDILINCAGIRECADPLEIDAAHWQRMLDINLSGSLNIIQAVARLWRAGLTRAGRQRL